MEKQDGQAQRTKRIPTEQTAGCGSSAMQGPVLEISLFQWSVELQRRNGHRVWTTPTNHISASRFKTRNPKFKIVLLSIRKQSNTSWSFID